MPRDDAHILDILNAGQEIEDFVRNFSVETFLEDKKTIFAFLHELIIIGEAANRISLDFLQQHPEIPWSEMKGMRNKLIHEYNDVDFNEVWQTASKDIPKLICLLKPLLPRKEK
jgi:uncharacterized protein with HEPN domain